MNDDANSIVGVCQAVALSNPGSNPKPRTNRIKRSIFMKIKVFFIKLCLGNMMKAFLKMNEKFQNRRNCFFVKKEFCGISPFKIEQNF